MVMQLRVERLGMMRMVQCTISTIFICLNVARTILFHLPRGAVSYRVTAAPAVDGANALVAARRESMVMQLRIERLGMMSRVHCTISTIFICLNVARTILFDLPRGQSLIE